VNVSGSPFLAAARALLDRIDPRIDWPSGAARLGVAGCVAATIAVGAVWFVRAIDGLDAVAEENASANFDDREFGGGNSLVVDKGALYEARALIPEGGTYRIVTGPGVQGASELTEPYIDQFARSFLMPRRPTSGSPWILCYGCDLSELDDRFRIVWTNDAGISLGRLDE
jgi:hypothetical protein